MACDHCADPPHSLKLAAQKKQDDNAYAETTFYVSLVSAIAILVRVCCCLRPQTSGIRSLNLASACAQVAVIVKKTRGRGLAAPLVGVLVGIPAAYAFLRFCIYPLWDILEPIVFPGGCRLDPLFSVPAGAAAGDPPALPLPLPRLWSVGQPAGLPVL